MPTNDQIIEALRPVQDPELHRSIVDLGMVRSVEVRSSHDVQVSKKKLLMLSVDVLLDCLVHDLAQRRI